MCNKPFFVHSCGWCQSSKRCEVKEKCGRDASSWLKRDQTCPNPQITHFHPMSGPWEGGTNITINGINLGKKYVDKHYVVKELQVWILLIYSG